MHYAAVGVNANDLAQQRHGAADRHCTSNRWTVAFMRWVVGRPPISA